MACPTDAQCNRNSTLFPAGLNATGQDYFGVYDEISKYNVQLNTLERLWAVRFSMLRRCPLPARSRSETT